MKNEKLFSNAFFIIIALYHIMVQTHSNGTGLIAYLFHFCIMWFFFRAGIYFKDEYTSNISNIVKIAARKYLIPFGILSAIGIVIDFVFFQQIENRTIFQALECSVINFMIKGAPYSNIPISFFLAMFVVHILFRYLAKYGIHTLALLLPMVDWILKNENISLPFGLPYVLYGLFYYTCGFLYQKYNFLKSIFVKFVSIIIYTYFILIEPEAIGASSELTLHGNIMNYLCTLSAIATYRAIMSWTPVIKESIIPNHLGEIVYGIHWPILFVLSMIISKKQLFSPSSTIILFLSTIILSIGIGYIIEKIDNHILQAKASK